MHQTRQEPTRRVAVIGAGVTGLSAAWLLNRSCDVVLYERDGRAGGHANTVVAQRPDGPVAVDTGFIVYNERNYPNLVAFFDHLGIATQKSEMSFAVSIDAGRTEYSGTDLNGLFARRANIVSPRFWGMLRDLRRFYRVAPGVIGQEAAEQATIGAYLRMNNYGDAFVEDHLLPMAAAIWSATPGDIAAFPLASFVRFFDSHGLLSLSDRPQWRTVTGGSASYVAQIANLLGDRVRLGAPVVEVRRAGPLQMVRDASGHEDYFTDVVIAAHADDILPLIAEPDCDQRAVLGAFSYTDNVAVLHNDPALMPRRRRAWASWNYLGDTQGSENKPLSATYWMNLLQNIQGSNLFVTLNPPENLAASSIYSSHSYRHPVFDHAALAAQRELWQVQGRNGLWFCGAWSGYGFHEDGVQAGLAVAEEITGARRPWFFDPAQERIHRHSPAMPHAAVAA